MKITRRICLRFAGERGAEAEAAILAGAGAGAGDCADGMVGFAAGVSSVVCDVEVVITILY